MILNKKQLHSVIFGAPQIDCNDSVVSCYRFSKKQIARIASSSQDFAMKAKSTSSVRLDFYTDSEYLAFSYANAQKAGSRPWYYFSLYVNGKRFAIFGEEQLTKTANTQRFELPAGEKRITLFFPNLFRADILSLELSDGASVTPFTPKRRIIFHGDSITQGYDAKDPATSYVNRLAIAWDAEIINYGIGGAMFDTQVIDEENVPDADLIFVSYGTNDWRHRASFQDFSINCKTFFEKIASVHPNIPVVAILPIWRQNYKDEFPVGDFMEARQEIARIAKETVNANVIDLWQDMPQDLMFFTDGLHPNDDGFAYYANGVNNKIKEQHVL